MGDVRPLFLLIMINRYWIDSGRFWKVFLAVILCGSALVLAPTASYSAAQKDIQCTVASTTSHAVSGQTISLDVTVTNTSSQTLLMLWPPRTRHLLEWGVLSVSIEDESGNAYTLVPLPTRYFLRQRSHYQRLDQGNKTSNNFNLCMFRDKNYSHSPCSRPGKYAVRIKCSNYKNDYYDPGTDEMTELNEVWTGEAMCNEIKIEVEAKE